MPKVFGIGFHKTGTTSLNVALQQLGYRITGPNGVNDPHIHNNLDKMCHDLVPKYDAFLDNPWPLLYSKLDKSYPDSKFILTMRPVDQWINSIVNHFGDETTPMRQMIYGLGSPKGNETIYKERYNQHNKDVLDYFSDRMDDLLILNISEGDGWETLCPFLGKKIIKEDFPHKNKAQSI